MAGRGVLRLYLKYHDEQPVIRELRRVSSPGLRRYVKSREIPRVQERPRDGDRLDPEGADVRSGRPRRRISAASCSP